ncbi:MAG: helix-turn-helix transcriptional regulator [Elusimicrobiota bacterium]
MKSKTIFTAEHRDIVRKLREARVAAKLTQVEVASKLRKPQSFVSKMESGERRLDIIELRRMSKLYGKPLSFFFPKE